MTKKKELVSEGHILAIWAVIIGSALLALIFPPIGTITFLAMGYWLILFVCGLLGIVVEHAATPPRRTQQVRESPKDAAVAAAWRGDWEVAWTAVCESPAEVAFLKACISHFSLAPMNRVLAGKGITLDMQRVILNMRVDFLINDKLVVEVDGAAYHSSPQARANDALRDAKLTMAGYRILRIPAKRVFHTPHAALEDLEHAIAQMAV